MGKIIDMRYFSGKGHKFDFLVDLGKRDSVKEYLSALGAHCIQYSFANVYLLGFSGWIPQEGVFLSGFVNINGRLVLGPCLVEGEPHDSSGDWITVSCEENRVVVSQDAFSTSAVFYGNDIVSNSLLLIYECLKESNSLTVNHSSLAANFLIESGFTWQASTFDTPVSGVCQLEAFSKLVIGGEIEVCFDSQKLDVVDYDEYWNLIEEGAKDIVSNVSAAVGSGRNLVAALTGGRDSRLVYSAILAGGYVDKVDFTTKDIGDDLRIASGILGRFGGSVTRGASSLKGRCYNEALSQCNSDNFYLYHGIDKLVYPVSWHHSVPTFLLGGTFGEIYRGFYHDIADSIKQSYPDADSGNAINDWIEQCAQDSFVHNDLVVRELSRTMSRLPRGEVERTLIDHYFNFRAKYHFGNSVHRDEKINLHPLQSKSLLELSLRVPSDVLFSGRIALDVTRVLCEELAYCEYDKDNQQSFREMRYHKPSRFDASVVKFSADDCEKGLKRYALARDQSVNKDMLPVTTARNGGILMSVCEELPLLVESSYSSEFFKVKESTLLKKIDWLKEKKMFGNLYKYYSIFSQLNTYINRM